MADNKCAAPRLSIVMPVYNHKAEVREMVESILANTFTDYELIAVDDGSDDGTGALLEDYASRDSRVRVMHRDRLPKGAPTCRNMGFDAARGELVVFFDSDDYVTPRCLETRVREIDAAPDLDFMVFPSGIYTDGVFSAEGSFYVYGYPGMGDETACFARRILPFIVWNNIYRAAALRRAGVRWDERLLSLQDADFNVAAITAGLTFAYAETEPDYGYRKYSAGTSSTVSRGIRTERQFSSHVHALRKMYYMIRAKHGHKYDRDLFAGVLNVYNGVMTGEGVNPKMARMLVEGIRDIDPKRSGLLARLVKTSAALEKVLPAKLARQLPMAPYLVANMLWKKHKMNIVNKKTRRVV